MKRRRVPAPILSASFAWHPAAEHDAGSDKFRQRQMERIKRMQQKPDEATVRPIKRRQA